MKFLSRSALAVSLSFALTSLVSAASLSLSAWPASSDGVAVDGSLDNVLPGNEPSGLTWHSGRDQLMGVSDEGEIFAMNTDGSGLTLWESSGDLEDITVADPNSSYVYLANEDGTIMKYNLSTGSTTQSWDIRSWLPEVACGSSSCGMEALTYADGYFYAGYQYNGKIYVFDLSGSSPVLVNTWGALSSYGYTSFSGLHYRDGYLYALYRNTMGVLDLNGNIVAAYSVPGSNPEGLALGEDSNGDGDANMFIAQDSSGVYSYDNFPLYGWTAAVTCTASTYYADADGDGLGSDTAASFCSSEVPTEYVSNSDDTNDSIPNAGVEILGDKVSNDGDTLIDEANLLKTNGPHPYYSTLDPNTSSASTIKSVIGLKNGNFGVRFYDNSFYNYNAIPGSTTTFSTVKRITGTAYIEVTLNGTTVVMNGYTGLPR